MKAYYKSHISSRTSRVWMSFAVFPTPKENDWYINFMNNKGTNAGRWARQN